MIHIEKPKLKDEYISSTNQSDSSTLNEEIPMTIKST